MSEKILNTRIQLKGDSFKNWTTLNPILKENELAIVKIEESDSHALGTGIYFKVGDGTKTFSELGFSGGIDGRVISEAISKDALVATINKTISDAGITTDEAMRALAGRVTTAEGKITTLESLVGSKSVETQIADAITELDLTNTYETKGAAAQALKDAKEYADGKVASVSATDESIIVSGTATAPTVAVQISKEADNDLVKKTDGLFVKVPDGAVYSITKDETSANYAAVYHLTKDGVNTGVAINIPKDMVVKSGTVEVNPAEQAAGTYLVLTLANATEDKVYINVGSLIEYVTSGSAESDMVVVAVSEDHKVTATITDGSITKAKLAAGVQTTLNKADSALQKADIVTGNANGTISVGGSDVEVKGLGTAAYKAVSDFDTAGAAAAVSGEVATLAGRVSTAETKLNTIAEGAQINIIETVKVNGIAQSVTEKAVNISVPTGNVKDLIQTDGDVLVLNCGSSTVNV